MVSKKVTVVPLTIGTISAGTGFPKIVFYADGTSKVAVDSAAQTTLVGEGVSGDIVWEAETTPTTTVAETPYDLVLGRDFDICVFSAPSDTRVVGMSIPAPVLNPAAALSGNNPSLSWTNTFGMVTKVYGTEKYTTGAPLTSFSLVTSVSGNPIPDTATTYIDTSVTLADNTESISYFVVNANGQSATVEFTGPA